MTPPHNIILHSNGEMVEQAMESLANLLQSKDIFIPGVIGVKNVADRFSQIWAKRAACGVELHAALRAYVLKSINHNLIGPGVFRPAEEGDLDFLTAGWVQFHIECGLQNEPVPENVVSNVQARIANGSLFVWEDEGQVVSVAAKTRSMRHGAVIGYVYTPHELRGRGYATSCVASMSQHLLDSGHEYCGLFTDLANPISNSIYQKIGYRPVGDYNNLRFDYE